MEKEKKKRWVGLFADMHIWLKFLILVFGLVLAVGITCAAAVRMIVSTQQDKYQKMEDTAVTAAEHPPRPTMRPTIPCSRIRL